MQSKYSGYMGKVVQIDLAPKKIEEYPWSDEQRKLFIGGKIMAAKILFDNFCGTEKPLERENIIVISTGPLTGTGAPSSSRFNISTLSPLTGILTSSNCGGNFGFYLKKAGYDALIIKGKADNHTWIEIDNDNIIFHNADDIWGTKISECQNEIDKKIKNEYGKNAKYGHVCIGPAGENLVKYAAVLSGERAAGRAGVGAVFGSKNIKAITVSGNKTIPIFDKQKTVKWNKKWFSYLKKHPLTGDQLPRLGTAGLVNAMHEHGLLATKNYTHGKNSNFYKVNGETLAEHYNIVNKGCLSCPIKCARTVEVDGKHIKGPELETLGLLSGGILNGDIELVTRWNYELDELGIDTISAANTLAYAMEANEKGIWDNGLEFGKTENISKLWHDIAYRRGIGDELAEGSRFLSKKYGGEDFAMHVKGLELAAYEPRMAAGQGLGYAVSNRGGCHLNGGYMVILEGLGLKTNQNTPKSKADFTMLFQDLMEMLSASGQCLFTSYAFFPGFLISHKEGIITSAVNATIPHIGWLLRFINRYPNLLAIHLPVFHHTKIFKYAINMPMNFGKYIRIGERGYNLERYINSRFGITAKDDSLPARFTQTLQDLNNPNSVVPLEVMKKTYYEARGWDENGVPKIKTLKKLNII